MNDIERMYREGYYVSEIAEELHIKIADVEAEIARLNDVYDGQPDEAQEWESFDPDC